MNGICDQPRPTPEYAMFLAKQTEIDYCQNKLNKPFFAPKWNIEDLRNHILENDKGFVVDQWNLNEFNLLCQYFSGDKNFEKGNKFSLDKGILMYGPIGCGKTRMMRAFAMNTFRPFGVVPCSDIADQYQEFGIDILQRFSSLMTVYPKHNLGFSQLGRCFDELGTEDTKSNFGNEANTMQNIITRIYNKKLAGNFHITTNLDGNDIEEYYGQRIRSRIREMFNVIRFHKDCPDRRK